MTSITNIKLIKTFKENSNIILFSNNIEKIKYNFNNNELDYIKSQIESDKKIIHINRYTYKIFIFISDSSIDYKSIETIRVAGSNYADIIADEKLEEIIIADFSEKSEDIEAFIEGFVLGNYTFRKYFTDKEKQKNPLHSIFLSSDNLKKEKLKHLSALLQGVYLTRDLSNEPFSALNSEDLAEIIKDTAKKSGLKAEILYKKQIEALQMGGILAVNKGSAYSPTFSILEWKPENPKNTKPIVIIGKGIVFDTGGYSLKPTKNSMDMMKHDMAGAAAVIGAMSVVALQKLPMHIIAIIPATDNTVDAKSYVPGDVITMHNKMTVEVLNTDAEGRLILADALSYAKKYEPEFVIDIATLTGAQVVAIGHQGIALLTNDQGPFKEKLIESGNNVYERLVELPLWDEYDELIKSDIADMKNVGGSEAGTITAAKFLQKFTDYNWAHLDIAGPAILSTREKYRTKGASGVGTRLFVSFFQNLAK